MSHFWRNFPHYHDDSDYTTNAPSYYDYLARINKMIKYLAKKVGHYDEELQKRFDEWDRQLEELPDELKRMLQEWFDDGILAEIMEELMLEEYARKDWTEELLEEELSKQMEIVEDMINSFKEEMNDNFDNLEERVDDKLKDMDEKKVDLEDYYTDEYNTKYYRDEESETSYLITTIKQKDKDGNRIRLKVTDDLDSTSRKTVQEFARMKGATLAINASPTSGANNSESKVTIMNDGDIRRTDSDGRDYNFIIGIDEKNNVKSFAPNTPADEIKSQGYVTALPGFAPLIDGGEDVSDQAGETVSNADEPHPRTVLCQNMNGDICFFLSTGRQMGEFGMTTKDVVRVLLNHNIKWAHMLDGGGSTTLVDHQQVVNKISGANSGDSGATVRPVDNILYIGKDKVNKSTTKLLSVLGDTGVALRKQKQYLESLRYQKNNYVRLHDYFINDWKAGSERGFNSPRAWVMPNNTIYFRGVVKAGSGASPDENEFMKLPVDYIPPIFETHHIVPGKKKGEIYKIIIQQDGIMKWYFWNDWMNSDLFDDDDYEFYIKLDGIFVPLNYTADPSDAEKYDLPRTQGIQKLWVKDGLEKE